MKSRSSPTRAAYELLTLLELRLKGTDLRDISVDQQGVTWPFLLNEYVIPRLQATGRISMQQAAALRTLQRPTRPTCDDSETWSDIHELLLGLYPAHTLDGEQVYRGQGEDWPLVPTVLRRDPSSALVAFSN
jgi:hypothetical protein